MTWWAISAFAFIYLTGGLAACFGMGVEGPFARNKLAASMLLLLWPAVFWATAACEISDKIAERLEREVRE